MLQNLQPIDSAEVSIIHSNSPWETTGCFITRHAAWFCVGLGILFWIYRSQYYSGDGDQLIRMVEAGVIYVQTELLSQAIFHYAYVMLKSFGWDGFRVVNLVSCIAGALSVWVLIKFNTHYVGTNPLWILGLFASSGLLLFCNGHTEYYTLFLITLFYYGYTGVGYLRGRISSVHVALAFSLAAWMHLGILFAFPTLLLLPLLRKRWSDYSGIACGLVLLAAAFALKDFSQIFGVDVHGLSPSKNFIPLFDDPTRERFYLMFQWGHLYDYLYGWTMRSWIFWPLIGWSILLFGWRSLMKPERFFLLLYTLAFTFFTITWHPNLGIHQDWDLYAIESAPCLLLLATYLPDLVKIHFRRVAILIPMLTSLLIGYEQLHREAHFGTRGCGNLKCVLSEKIPCQINLNGHLKKLNNMGIREGVYEGRLRNVLHMRSHFFYAVVSPNRETTVFFHVGAQEGRGGPDRYLDETMTKLRLSADDAFEQ